MESFGITPPVAALLLMLLLLTCAVEAGSWQDCGQRFAHALAHHDVHGNVSRYLYTQRPGHLRSGGTAPLMATYEGCVRFCGAAKQPTAWDKATDSLLTWTLPLGCLLLQAPFESNRFWATYFSLARWLGSSIVAIGGTLWNIRATSRCAALLDWSVGEGEGSGSGGEASAPGDYTHTMAGAERTGFTSLWHSARARMALWLVGRDGLKEPQSGPHGGANAFSDMRDSLYILSVVNQYELSHDDYVDDVDAFILFALFSGGAGADRGLGVSLGNTLNNSVASVVAAGQGAAPTADAAAGAATKESSTSSAAAASGAAATMAAAEETSLPRKAHITARTRLRRERAELAEHLRATRKHGVVPVLFSLLGFALALAISIARTYGHLGSNYSEYNLALGLLMTWLPVLVACTLLDRNPTNADLTRKALQRFFDGALREWQQLQRPRLPRPSVLPTIDVWPASVPPQDSYYDEERMSRTLGAPTPSPVPSPMLVPSTSPSPSPSPLPPPMESLEPSPLRPSSSPPTKLPQFVLAFSGQVRRKWHRGVAYAIITHLEHKARLPNGRLRRRNQEPGYLDIYEQGHFSGADGDHHCATDCKSTAFFDTVQAWQLLAALLVVGPAVFGAFTVSYNTPTIGIGCRSGGYMVFFLLTFGCFLLDMLGSYLHHPLPRPRGRVAQAIPTTTAAAAATAASPAAATTRTAPKAGNPRQRAANAVRLALTALEVLSSSWLLVILLAQTFGLYQTCFCRASMWTGRFARSSGAPGGYVDFVDDDYYRQHYVLTPYWRAGTALGCAPLLVVLYAVAQWCRQSFLWSVDYARAMRGLRRVRRARYWLGGGGVWRDGAAAVARGLRRVVRWRGIGSVLKVRRAGRGRRRNGIPREATV